MWIYVWRVSERLVHHFISNCRHFDMKTWSLLFKRSWDRLLIQNEITGTLFAEKNWKSFWKKYTEVVFQYGWKGSKKILVGGKVRGKNWYFPDLLIDSWWEILNFEEFFRYANFLVNTPAFWSLKCSKMCMKIKNFLKGLKYTESHNKTHLA